MIRSLFKQHRLPLNDHLMGAARSGQISTLKAPFISPPVRVRLRPPRWPPCPLSRHRAQPDHEKRASRSPYSSLELIYKPENGAKVDGKLRVA